MNPAAAHAAPFAQAAPSWAQALACAYVLLPVAIFFLLYVAWWIAVPAVAALGWAIVSVLRRARRFVPDGLNVPLLFMAALWVFLCGGLGVLGQTFDWQKHYAVLNQLAGPGIAEPGGEVLRYALAWYLVPALLVKATGLKYALGWWTLLGVFLLFRLLADLAGGGRRALLVPAVFAVFSGADILGRAITGFQMGPLLHIEWWSRWIEYGSHTTSLTWVPQHALAAWLVVALIAGQLRELTLRSQLGLLLAATLLWSPFAAIGLVPFALLLVRRDTLADWRNWMALVVALPLVVYLTAGSGNLPASWPWTEPCDTPDLCFSGRNYLRFAAIEFLVPAVVLLAWRRDRIVLVATASLLLIPLFRFGAGNDFGMRGSIPALAALGMAAGLLLADSARLRYAVPMAAVLALGSITASLEIAQRFLDARVPSPTAMTFGQMFREAPAGDVQYLRPQYFAKPPEWLVRR